MHPSTKNVWRDRKTVTRDNLPTLPRVFPAESRRRRRRWKAFRPRAPHPRRGNAARRCFNKRLVPNRKSFNPFRSRLTRVLYAFKRRGYFWRRREGGREARDAQYVINIDRAESGNGSPTPVLRAIPPAIKHFHSHRPLKPAPRKLLYR